MTDMGADQEHPTMAIFNKSDRLSKALCVLQSDVELIEKTLLGTALPKESTERGETPILPFLEDVEFRFKDHINQVEEIQNIVSAIKASLISTSTIK